MSDPGPTALLGARAPGAADEAVGFAGLVLASRSPQRKMLLEQLGIPFRIVVSDHDEGVSDGNPAHTVQQNARGKAEEVLAREQLRPGELVLGVDTVVVSEGEILGKARDEDEAARYVRRLAARRHEVYSGLYLTSQEAGAGRARRHRRHLPQPHRRRARRATSRSGEWRDRAGAYAIQGIGSALVQRVDGDYFNVVGLPVAELLRLLAGFGVTPFSWLQHVAAAASRRPREGTPRRRRTRLCAACRRRRRRACAPVAMPRGTVYNRRSRFASKGARHQLPRIRNGLWRP